jgi:hypothetical protein
VNILDAIEKLLDIYVWITPKERLLTALWILHTYVYDRYTFTPRLALLSPVYGCGKTTLMILLEYLCHNPVRVIVPSPASLFRLMDEEPRTLLIDEGDNLNFSQDKVLRAVLNANRRSDKITRATSQGVRYYLTYAPVGIAAVGRLPNSLMQLSVIVDMKRHPPGINPLTVLNELEVGFRATMEGLQGEIIEWVDNCQLDPNPPNPIRNRGADNWRGLFAIADYFGRGDDARAATVKMTSGLPDDDKKVFLLMDIRDVFDDLGVDRIWTKTLLEKLHEGEWSEYSGLNDEKPSHALTAIEMSRILRDFKITPGTIFKLGSRGKRGPSAQGYYSRQFEPAWGSYCPPKQPKPVKVVK